MCRIRPWQPRTNFPFHSVQTRLESSRTPRLFSADVGIVNDVCASSRFSLVLSTTWRDARRVHAHARTEEERENEKEKRGQILRRDTFFTMSVITSRSSRSAKPRARRNALELMGKNIEKRRWWLDGFLPRNMLIAKRRSGEEAERGKTPARVPSIEGSLFPLMEPRVTSIEPFHSKQRRNLHGTSPRECERTFQNAVWKSSESRLNSDFWFSVRRRVWKEREGFSRGAKSENDAL